MSGDLTPPAAGKPAGKKAPTGKLAARREARSLSVQALWAAPLREDQRRPVAGWYVLLQRPA